MGAFDWYPKMVNDKARDIKKQKRNESLRIWLPIIAATLTIITIILKLIKVL